MATDGSSSSWLVFGTALFAALNRMLLDSCSSRGSDGSYTSERHNMNELKSLHDRYLFVFPTTIPSHLKLKWCVTECPLTFHDFFLKTTPPLPKKVTPPIQGEEKYQYFQEPRKNFESKNIKEKLQIS